MPNSRLRFAILGFGHHALRRLVPAFRHSEHTVLQGAWRRDTSALARDCADHNIPLAFPTKEDLCASAEIDAVFITSPDALHCEDALLTFAHGKAVLCEKPLSMNAAEAETMVAAAEHAHALFGVAQNFRYNRSLEWIAEQIQAGRIGDPQLALAQFCYPADRAPRTWIADPSLACGGPIGDVGVHCIDALRFVLEQEVLEVRTLARHDAQNSHPGAVEAVASLQLKMSGDIFSDVTVSARASYRTLLEVSGTDGVLTAENAFNVERSSELSLQRSGDLIERLTVSNADGYTRMLDSFAQASRGETNFRAPGADGLQNMRILDAAYRSWHTGQAETVSPRHSGRSPSQPTIQELD